MHSRRLPKLRQLVIGFFARVLVYDGCYTIIDVSGFQDNFCSERILGSMLSGMFLADELCKKWTCIDAEDYTIKFIDLWRSGLI